MTLQAPVLNLDPAKAEMADAGGRISSTGGYRGVIKQMKWRSSDTGAAGYVIDFENVDGQITQGLFICTIKRDGNVNDIGDRQMSALLCCLGLRSTNPIQARIMEDVYNEQLSRYEELEVTAWIYPDVCDKPIGMVLQKELTSRASDGADSYRMQFIRSFQHTNNRTAAEMLAASKAKKAGQPEPPAISIERLLESIEDKDSRNKEAISHYGNATVSEPANGATDPFQDDIPF